MLGTVSVSGDVSVNANVNPELACIGSPRSSQYEEGKRFFKEARKALPFDKFNLFIKQIQLLNKNQISKDAALNAAEQLFGDDNTRLLDMFKHLVLKKSIDS